MKNITVLIIIFLILFSGKEDEIQKKIFRQDGYDIECFVYIKEVEKFHPEKLYYWYRSQELHQSIGQSGGEVLHQQFKKFDRNNQLVEEGSFDYGLKNEKWKEWYSNGALKKVINYRDGYKDGEEITFNSEGRRISIGKYSKNRKIGRWINYISGDTLYYKKDSIYESKPTTKVGRLIRKLFQERDSIEIVKRKMEKLQRKKADSLERAIQKEIRIKKKKEKSKEKRGQ